MLDREIAGITCRAVLERLEDYLAGDLAERETEAVEAHLADCDRCTRFGGLYAGVCRDLREQLGRPDPVDDGVRARMKRRLDLELARATDDPTR